MNHDVLRRTMMSFMNHDNNRFLQQHGVYGLLLKTAFIDTFISVRTVNMSSEL
uniref:Uncharacterized protein n=1 Tax=Arion vulgaris TaxID=1028688 RepID=A0A0B6YPS2_9EUPU